MRERRSSDLPRVLETAAAAALICPQIPDFPTDWSVSERIKKKKKKQSREETFKMKTVEEFDSYMKDGNKPDFVVASSISQTDSGWIHFLSSCTERSRCLLMRHSGSECCLIIHSEKMQRGFISSGQLYFFHYLLSRYHLLANFMWMRFN